MHTPLVSAHDQQRRGAVGGGHLYKNDALVTDNAMVHVMLLSRTRRASDFALDCWDCSKNTIEELQLQILPGPNEPKLDAPGGFLFVNWEKSGSDKAREPGRVTPMNLHAAIIGGLALASLAGCGGNSSTGPYGKAGARASEVAAAPLGRSPSGRYSVRE